MALQLYAGGKLLSHDRKDTLYNAYMYDQAESLRNSEYKHTYLRASLTMFYNDRGTDEWPRCLAGAGKGQQG